MSSGPSYRQPPAMRDDLPYAEWKKELNIWSDFTDLDEKRQGGALFLTLTGKAREAVLAGVTRDKIKSDKGITEIVTCLDELYLKDENQCAFTAYDDFTSYRRSHNMSIHDYIVEFNLKYNRIKTHDMKLPDAVLAYYLLKCANLSEEQTNLCKATCADLTYKSMRSQIEKVTSAVSDPDRSQPHAEFQPQFFTYDDYYQYEEDYDYNDRDEENVNEEQHDTYYAQPSRYRTRPPYTQQWPGRGRSQRAAGPPRPRQNPPDEFGNPSRCNFCRSVYHWIDRCPDAPRPSGGPRGRGFARPARGRGAHQSAHFTTGDKPGFIWQESDHPGEQTSDLSDAHNVVLLTDPSDDHPDLMSETIGYVIIDSGCTQTVCGNTWFKTYLDTLSNRVYRTVRSEESKCSFRFGDGPVYTSTRVAFIPITLGTQKVTLRTYVVDCDVPLLMSRQSLKRAQCHIDFVHDKVYMFGEEVPMKLSRTGHYCVPLVSEDKSGMVKNVLFTSPVDPSDSNKSNHKKVLKLHKQFAHPAPDRLKRLIWDSGVKDTAIDKTVDEVSQNCDICKRFRRSPARPVVTFPLATEFNETIAMDIKFINSRPVLHLIDHATRYSRACLLANKKPMSVVQAIITHWIQVFGQPTQFLTDNGGEFVNSELIELAEKFNIVLKTTAAESPWSNGLCEKHNGVIGDMVAKIQAGSTCSLELAIPWAVSAKNGLSNVYGFSPNQLVFGRNVRLPDVHNNNPLLFLAATKQLYEWFSLSVCHTFVTMFPS